MVGGILGVVFSFILFGVLCYYCNKNKQDETTKTAVIEQQKTPLPQKTSETKFPSSQLCQQQVPGTYATVDAESLPKTAPNSPCKYMELEMSC